MNIVGDLIKTGLAENEVVLPPAPFDLFESASKHHKAALVAYILLTITVTVGSIVMMFLLPKYWWLYPALGLGIPLLCNLVRTVMISYISSQLDESFNKCIEDYGDPRTVWRAIEQRPSLSNTLIVVTACLFLSDISPIATLFLYAVVGVPLGLLVITVVPLLSANLFILTGGLVPGILLIAMAREMVDCLRACES